MAVFGAIAPLSSLPKSFIRSDILCGEGLDLHLQQLRRMLERTRTTASLDSLMERLEKVS